MTLGHPSPPSQKHSKNNSSSSAPPFDPGLLFLVTRLPAVAGHQPLATNSCICHHLKNRSLSPFLATHPKNGGGGGHYVNYRPKPQPPSALETYAPPGASFMSEAGAFASASGAHHAPLGYPGWFCRYLLSFCLGTTSCRNVHEARGCTPGRRRASRRWPHGSRWRHACILSCASDNPSHHHPSTNRWNRRPGDSPGERHAFQAGGRRGCGFLAGFFFRAGSWLRRNSFRRDTPPKIWRAQT